MSDQLTVSSLYDDKSTSSNEYIMNSKMSHYTTHHTRNIFNKPTLTMYIMWHFIFALLSATTEGSGTISNSVTIASCRAACLHVFTTASDSRDIKCRKNSDCHMCWNSCGVLRHQSGIWGSMCADHAACLPGCQVACGFYLSASRTVGGIRPHMVPPPPPLPAYQPPPRISGRSQVVWGALDWSGSADPARDDIIYVLFINSGSGWREVIQTSGRNTHMPPGVTGMPRLRLLAVTQEGVVAASDTLLQTHPTQHGAVEYIVEDLRPDASAPILQETSINSTPKHTTSSQPHDIPESTISEFYPYKHFESQKVQPEDSASHPPVSSSALVDPTWILQTVSVESGIMAEVKMAWESRGPEGVEYLLSWMEEAGGVSGHLLTNQLTTELSLWPGQNYYLQVELVDSQGNPVMKSLATPVSFRSPATDSSLTERNTPSTAKFPEISTSIPDTVASREVPTTPVLDESFRRIWLNNGTLIGQAATSETKPDNGNLMIAIDNPDSTLPELVLPTNITDYTKESTQVDKELPKPNRDSEISTQRPQIYPRGRPRDPSSTGVSAREIPSVMLSEGGSEEVLWYIGVSIGILLILILCSLVLWSLGKCRTAPPTNSEYMEDRLNGVRESFREDFIRRNATNPQTSWTFEKYCAANRESSRVGSPARKENLPVGIDNASLVENYVLMLESRPPKKKPRH